MKALEHFLLYRMKVSMVMDLIVYPKCDKKLNDYEINKRWCTNCNARFESVQE